MPMFPPNNFTVLTYIYIHFGLVSIWNEAGNQNHSFACGYLIVPALFAEKAVLSPTELSSHPCQKSVDYQYIGLLLNSQFYSMPIYVIYMINTY